MIAIQYVQQDSNKNLIILSFMKINDKTRKEKIPIFTKTETATTEKKFCEEFLVNAFFILVDKIYY